jgi:hypothetical protein
LAVLRAAFIKITLVKGPQCTDKQLFRLEVTSAFVSHVSTDHIDSVVQETSPLSVLGAAFGKIALLELVDVSLVEGLQLTLNQDVHFEVAAALFVGHVAPDHIDSVVQETPPLSVLGAVLVEITLTKLIDAAGFNGWHGGLSLGPEDDGAGHGGSKSLVSDAEHQG